LADAVSAGVSKMVMGADLGLIEIACSHQCRTMRVNTGDARAEWLVCMTLLTQE